MRFVRFAQDAERPLRGTTNFACAARLKHYFGSSETVAQVEIPLRNLLLENLQTQQQAKGKLAPQSVTTQYSVRESPPVIFLDYTKKLELEYNRKPFRWITSNLVARWHHALNDWQ